uniref:Uncharacterized protein n=1 Tax=Ciona intestinalis TaxID=7719 RepID=H2XLD9_CIOIN
LVKDLGFRPDLAHYPNTRKSPFKSFLRP